jgi:hypothetical protein
MRDRAGVAPRVEFSDELVDAAHDLVACGSDIVD